MNLTNTSLQATPCLHLTQIRNIAPDFRTVTVDLKMGYLNPNYVGTHFGGRLE